MLIEDDELDAVTIESNHTIEIDSFVPREQMDERYLASPYYLVPDDRVGQEAFAVIRDAMRGKDMVALARIVLAKRERVVMLQPWEKGLIATTAVSLRGAGHEGLLRRHTRDEATARHAPTRRAHPRNQGRW